MPVLKSSPPTVKTLSKYLRMKFGAQYDHYLEYLSETVEFLLGKQKRPPRQIPQTKKF